MDSSLAYLNGNFYWDMGFVPAFYPFCDCDKSLFCYAEDVTFFTRNVRNAFIALFSYVVTNHLFRNFSIYLAKTVERTKIYSRIATKAE